MSRVRRRRANSTPGRPEDEFLRALKSRQEQEKQEAGDRATAPEGPGERVATPGAHAAETSGAQVEILTGRVAEAERRAESAEQAVAQAREESERRLADARAAIEREREARVALEKRVHDEQDRAQREASHAQPADRQMSEELEERRRAVAEAERDAREERQRWEEDARVQVERRAAELAEAERRIAEARAALAREPGAATPRGEEIDLPRPKGSILERLRRGLTRRRLDTECITCGSELAAASVSELRANGWAVGSDGRALCSDCQSEGWHFPHGAALPFRQATSQD